MLQVSCRINACSTDPVFYSESWDTFEFAEIIRHENQSTRTGVAGYHQVIWADELARFCQLSPDLTERYCRLTVERDHTDTGRQCLEIHEIASWLCRILSSVNQLTQHYC